MFNHIFKLIWKKKKSNFLMMLEIFFSFLILFVVWSLSVYTYRNYGTPSGLSTDNVWTVYLDFNTGNDTLRSQYKDLIRQHLNAEPEIVAQAFHSNNIPFGNSSSNSGFTYKGKETNSNIMFVDQSLPANNAEYEAKLDRDLHQLGKDWTIEIQHMDNMLATKDQFVLIPLLILAIVCGFLIFNVGLGLFGVLFQNISRRKGEIGIRRAIGATQRQVWRYFVGETLVIATFGVVLGIFFAVQILLLHVLDVDASVYVWGILWAALSIYLIAIICSFYPSRQAAAIYPAVALHEE